MTRDRYQREKQHLARVYDRDPARLAVDARERETMPNERLSGLYPGAAVILIGPSLKVATTALIERIIDPETDMTPTVTGMMIPFGGELPRIDLFYVRERTGDDVARSAPQRAQGQDANLHPVEIIRALNVPHARDVERACLLADGNLTNVVNLYRYLIIHGVNAS